MKEVALIRSAVLPQIKPTHPCRIGEMVSFISDGDMKLIKKGLVAKLVGFGLYFMRKWR